MSKSAAKALATPLDALGAGPVTCIGDIMLDRFIHGTVDRISPEAAIPVIHIGGQTEMLGAAGNVLRNLAALGVGTRLVTIVGDDADGERIDALAAVVPQAESTLIRDQGRCTTVKCRYIAGSQQLLRADSEDRHPLDETLSKKVMKAAAEAIAGSRAVIVSDYGKGMLTQQIIAHIIATAATHDIPVVIDPVGRDYSRYRGGTLLTPNRKELFAAAEMEGDGEAEIVAACQKLIKQCGVGAILATRGAEGMTLVQGDGEPISLPARAREVYDVSGAGDTVAAVTAAGLAGDLPLGQAIELANMAAGIVIGKVGTAVATSDELRAQMTLANMHELARERANKLIDLTALDAQIAQWRREGLRIGFTNGCFDVVHPGHVSLLEQASDACDRLIVGLNTDASVAQLKGPDRPVQDENARARVIGSVAGVDAVVLFGEQTPEGLIKRIRPDALIKGADYTVETTVGADFVRSYGGKIVLAELVPGHSTSAAIARMVK